MKQRSITERNVLGAFLGGTLGILTVGYLGSTFLMVVACFAGVIGGWWYQELWQSATTGYASGLAHCHGGMKRIFDTLGFLFTPAHKLNEWRKTTLKSWWEEDAIMGLFATIVLPVVSMVVWVLRRPVATYQWLGHHPANQLYAIRGLAVLTFWSFMIPLFGGVFYEAHITHQTFGWILTFVGCALVVTFPFLAWDLNGDTIEKMRMFYRSIERYTAVGPVRMFALEVWHLFHFWSATIVFAGIALLTFVGFGGVFLMFAGIVAAAVAFLRGVYQVSMRSGHWLCFGVTLVVTAMTAWIARPYLSNVQMLWVLALGNGCITAILTEASRRALVWMFMTKRATRATALVPIGRQLAPSGRWFWSQMDRLYENVGNMLLGPPHSSFA